MRHRLYLPDLADGPGEIELDAERAHYLIRVLRLRTGSELACFDGAGAEWRAALIAAGPRRCVIRRRNLLREEPPAAAPLLLAVAWLKGAAMDNVVQKATELGAAVIQPVLAERSNAGRSAAADQRRLQSRLEHWRRVAISACEQSQRLYLPELPAPLPLTDFLAYPPAAARVILDPGAPPLPLTLPKEPFCLLVGPEGGWTDAERQQAAAAGFARYGLGELVLRAETAPIAALAAVRHSWGWG